MFRVASVALLCAPVAATDTFLSRNLREGQVLQAEATVTGNKCSAPCVPRGTGTTAKTTCDARARSWATGGCHLCADGQFDERSSPDSLNVCVAKSDHCIVPKEKSSRLISYCTDALGAGCGLTERKEYRVNWYDEGHKGYETAKVNEKTGQKGSKIHQELEKVSVLTTTGAATFFHASAAADAIVSSNKLLSSKGGTAGGGNSDAAGENCKGYVYLFTSKTGADATVKAAAVLKTVLKGFGDGMDKTKVKVVKVTVPAGFEVEFDPDMPETVRHKGDVAGGSGITIALQATA